MLHQLCRYCYSLSRFSSRSAAMFHSSGGSLFTGASRISYKLWPVRRFSSPSTTTASTDVILRQSVSGDKLERTTAVNEKRDVQELLNLIIEKTRSRGVELVFAESFVESLNSSPLSMLLNDGPQLKMDYIAEAFSLRPKFLEIPTTKWRDILKTFREADISLAIVLAALVGNPEIFELDPKQINATLVELSTWGIRDRVLASVLAKRPQIISYDLKKIGALIENMTSFFPRRKVGILIRKDPELLFMDFDEIEAKYEYIYNEMGLEPALLLQSNTWYRLPLSDIECRHLFLVRCGVYVMPDEKKRDVAADNPSLPRILDTTDEEFCRVAGVSLLEWRTFKKIYDTEEPLKTKELNMKYLKRTRRVAPKVEARHDWEDVRLDEIEGRVVEETEDYDEFDDDADFRDEDHHKVTRKERRAVMKEENMSFMKKRQFRKRGVFLASED